MRIEEFIKKNYIIKNFYFLNSFLEFSKKNIGLRVENIELRNLLLGDQYYQDDDGIVVECNKVESEFDRYTLFITFKNKIKIEYSSKRSLRYVCNLLKEMVIYEEDKTLLPMCLIEDEASFKYRGIIEGYYGTPWTIDNRLDMIEFMDEYRLNTYMYAPKCDSYHRDKWYELYPKKEIEEFKTIINLMKDKDIDFYYCISPGHAPEGEKGFIYVGEEDFNRLYKKLDQLIDLGVSKFGLLLDDIDYHLTGKNLEIFKRPGIAHAHICNKVYNYLKGKINNLQFVMCPTEYHEIGTSEYRNDLKNNLDDNIYVYWTGDNVCAEVITDYQIEVTKAAFNKPIMLWENFPVSDFTYGVRQFIAPIKNRSVDLPKYIDGYLINPMIHYELSKVAMITEAHYAWNTYKYDCDKSFDIALHYFGDDLYDAWYDYVYFNYPSVLSYGNLMKEKKMVEDDDFTSIKEYYHKVVNSCLSTLNLDLHVVDELKPWLNRTIEEQKIVLKMLDNKLSHEELIKFLEDIKFSGSELFDYLVKKRGLLSDGEYTDLIKKRRGNPWYRVWEYKR